MSAAVLQFPANVQRQAKRRMDRVELEALHRWMMGNRAEWRTEATNGAEYEKDAQTAWIKKELYKAMGWTKPTMSQMRRDIAEGRRLIEKRNSVKRWLASLGVDLAEIKNPEQALFAAFDKLA